jgi:hypothetical protein
MGKDILGYQKHDNMSILSQNNFIGFVNSFLVAMIPWKENFSKDYNILYLFHASPSPILDKGSYPEPYFLAIFERDTFNR